MPMWICRDGLLRVAAAGQVQVLAFRRAAADKNRIELTGREQIFEARHR